MVRDRTPKRGLWVGLQQPGGDQAGDREDCADRGPCGHRIGFSRNELPHPGDEHATEETAKVGLPANSGNSDADHRVDHEEYQHLSEHGVTERGVTGAVTVEEPGAENTKDRPRRPDRDRGSGREHNGGDSADDSGAKVQPCKRQRLNRTLEGWSENVEGVHVHTNVKESGMEEHRRDDAVDLAVSYQPCGGSEVVEERVPHLGAHRSEHICGHTDRDDGHGDRCGLERRSAHYLVAVHDARGAAFPGAFGTALADRCVYGTFPANVPATLTASEPCRGVGVAVARWVAVVHWPETSGHAALSKSAGLARVAEGCGTCGCADVGDRMSGVPGSSACRPGAVDDYRNGRGTGLSLEREEAGSGNDPPVNDEAETQRTARDVGELKRTHCAEIGGFRAI